MLRRLSISNFKSLESFALPADEGSLPNFVCLIGLNGAGKSSVLQAMDFLCHLMWGDLAAWLSSRDWKASDLTSKLSARRNIAFSMDVELPDLGLLTWSGEFNPVIMRCVNERVKWNDFNLDLLNVDDGRVSGLAIKYSPISFEYQGSILSQLKLIKDKHVPLISLRDYVRSWKSLELLAPNLMRGRSRAASDIGSGGQQLAGFLHALSAEQKDELTAALQTLYPHILGFKVRRTAGGWVSLEFLEDVGGTPMRVPVQHANDGMLRILAILAQTFTDHKFLLFDEIENGINSELIGKLVSHLLALHDKQVMVTTHSPLILNFLPDELAKRSVILLYRNRGGATEAVRFFDLAVPRKKLEIMGPGEVMLDTYLEDVVRAAAEPD